MKKVTLGLPFLSLFLSFTVYGAEKYQDKQYYFDPSLKNYGTGKGVIVAVIDTGVWQQHPDLKGSEWLNKGEIPNNGKDDDKNGYVDDYYGWNFIDNNNNISPKGFHGTSVAGIIAAQINEQGIAGLAPDAKIMSLIVCASNGCPDQAIISAIHYAADKGVNIINLSLGGQGYVGYNPDYDAAVKYAYDKGVIIVASAGNGDPESNQTIGQNLDFLQASPVSNDALGINMVIGVGASSYVNKKPLGWSNYGKNVDVWAQGDSVATTTDPKYRDASYEWLDGTSFSAPIISAYAAIAKSRYPALKAYEIIDALSSGSTITTPEFFDRLSGGGNCQINSFNASVTNGDKILIHASHLRSNIDFYIASSAGMEIPVKDAIDILDANQFYLDTKKLTLPQGNYTLKSANCSIAWHSIDVIGVSAPQLRNVVGSTGLDSSLDLENLTNSGIITKKDNLSDYRLNDSVLRQEVVGIGAKLAQLEMPEDYMCRNIFKDVSQKRPNTWICRSVELAGYKGIISIANPSFRPEDSITKAEALAILLKAADIKIDDSTSISQFSDVSVSWQINIVNTALNNGVLDLSTKFEPNKKATRKEIFNMASRILLLRK